jgi:DNA-binding transcriptional LysR family regulator
LRERRFVDYRADSALHAQIDVACAAAGLARRTICEAQNMQYLTELVQHGLGIAVLPPASLRAVTAEVATLQITPPIRRDLCAVVAAGRPPTGAAHALLDLLAANIDRRRGHGRRGEAPGDPGPGQIRAQPEPSS